MVDVDKEGLWREYRDSSGDARELVVIGKIVCAYDFLLNSEAGKLVARSDGRLKNDFYDLKQEGAIKMVEIIPGFDSSKGEFENYARIPLRRAMIDYLRCFKPLGFGRGKSRLRCLGLDNLANDERTFVEFINAIARENNAQEQVQAEEIIERAMSGFSEKEKAFFMGYYEGVCETLGQYAMDSDIPYTTVCAMNKRLLGKISEIAREKTDDNKLKRHKVVIASGFFDFSIARRLRDKLGITRKALADRLGAHPQQILNFEQGCEIPSSRPGSIGEKYRNFLRENGIKLE